MSGQLREYVDIAPYTSFALGGIARYFADVADARLLPDFFAFAAKHSLPVSILGGGTNVIVSDEPLQALFLHVTIPGFSLLDESIDSVRLRVGAGELWDGVVAKTIALGLSGIEALSGIPGTVGATPVQNVGAYGQEIAQVLLSVEAFDVTAKKMTLLTAAECRLGYRTSIFKTTHRNRYVITAIEMNLSKKPPLVPRYPGVQEYFLQRSISSPSLAQIREAILAIRAQKLPAPSTVPNVGSFFKNPCVSHSDFETLQKEYPAIPHFKQSDSTIKIPAGWLIEHCGFKGKYIGNVQIYPQNALVLTHTHPVTYREVEDAVSVIQKAVWNKFQIVLEPEPVFVK